MPDSMAQSLVLLTEKFVRLRPHLNEAGLPRGYSYGGVAELDWDDWAVRFGRITPPKNPNQLPVDFRLFKYYGDQIELEHKHKIFGQEGMVRALGYRNHEDM